MNTKTERLGRDGFLVALALPSSRIGHGGRVHGRCAGQPFSGQLSFLRTNPDGSATLKIITDETEELGLEFAHVTSMTIESAPSSDGSRVIYVLSE